MFRRDPFADFEREFEEMSHMMDEMMDGLRQLDWRDRPSGEPAYYGVSVNVGPDGIPHVERFGNVHPHSGSAAALDSHTREPFATSVYDEARGIIQVTAELPGVDESAIEVEIHGDELVLRASGNERTYEKTIQLPVRADTKSLTQKYHNGVLEVTLKKEA